MLTYRLLRPLLFALPAESAHELTHRAGRTIAGTRFEEMLGRRLQIRDARLSVEAFDTTFPNPVGVAAGFDKNARIPGLLGSLGFGHVEVGGVTARSQVGNPKPRLFRLKEDDALINRMGFNNDGADRIEDRLAGLDSPQVPLGVNIGKSKDVPAEEAAADYRYTFDRLAGHAAFAVINVSSPNTPGLRELQAREHLEAIVTALQEADEDVPLLVKLSPDLHEDAVEEVLAIVDERGLDGVVATNTTVDRPVGLRSPNRAQEGGLSGRPLADRSTELVAFVSRRTAVPVIGVGGIFTAGDAYEKLRAGASLVQLYTGLVYRGPSIAREINAGLLRLLERDGYESVGAVVGADLD